MGNQGCDLCRALFGFVRSSKQLGPFTGRTAVAVSSGEAGDARENMGVSFRARAACLA